MRAKALQALAVLLVAVSTGAGQITGPSEVTIRVGGRAAQIVVKVDGDASSARYSILGDAIDAFREYEPSGDTLRIRIQGLVDGGEGFLVVSANKNGKPLEHYVCVVKVGKPKPPTPPTPPDPTPEPVSTFAKAIQNAAAKDGYAKVRLIDLSDAFLAISVGVGRAESGGVLQDSVVEKLKPFTLSTSAPNVRTVLQGAMDALDDVLKPGSTSKPLTDDEKLRAKAAFERIAKGLLEAAR